MKNKFFKWHQEPRDFTAVAAGTSRLDATLQGFEEIPKNKGVLLILK
jgi:hypothetical protein